MTDVLGVLVTRGRIKGALAAIAVAVGAGYGIYRTGQAIRRRRQPETDAQKVTRLEGIFRRFPESR